MNSNTKVRWVTPRRWQSYQTESTTENTKCTLDTLKKDSQHTAAKVSCSDLLRSVQTKELLGGVQGTGFFIPKFIEITSSQGKRVKSDDTVIEIMLIFCMSYILTE